MSVCGIVLAGGRSSRMGTDKAQLRVGSDSLLQRTVRTVLQVADSVLVVGRTGPPSESVRYLPDTTEHRGPLGGLVTGLSVASAPLAVVVACDMPFLNWHVLRYLLAESEEFDAVVPVVRGESQPLHAVYSASCLDVAKRRLEEGRLSLRALCDELRVRWVDAEVFRELDPKLLSFQDANTPHDWESAINPSHVQR